MIPNMKKIGHKIMTVRQILGITRDELVEMSGVCRKTLQNVENGKGMTVSTLLKIAEALNVPPAKFF